MERFFYFFIKGKWKRLKTHTHQKNQNQKTTHNINQPTKKPTDKSNAGAKGVSSHFLDGPKFIRWGYLKAMRMPSHTHNLSASLFIFPKKAGRKMPGAGEEPSPQSYHTAHPVRCIWWDPTTKTPFYVISLSQELPSKINIFLIYIYIS